MLLDKHEEHDIHLRLAASARNSLKECQEHVPRISDYYLAFLFYLQKIAVSQVYCLSS